MHACMHENLYAMHDHTNAIKTRRIDAYRYAYFRERANGIRDRSIYRGTDWRTMGTS